MGTRSTTLDGWTDGWIERGPRDKDEETRSVLHHLDRHLGCVQIPEVCFALHCTFLGQRERRG